jgi:hypothetical protein
MSLLHLSDSFEFVPGTAPVAVGAPHHGTRPSVDADWGTGPIARDLAARLGGSSVVVSDIRRTVDVNKDPFSLGKGVRQHAVRYQNGLFANRSQLIVEIHGHTSGRYDIEVSTGFELDQSISSDASYMEKLHILRRVLPEVLENRLGKRPTIGVWPLDRDVEKTATNTFTFQKVRRARHLVGLDWFGLHIELNASLRVSGGKMKSRVHELSPQVVGVLSEAMAVSIRMAFEPLLAAQAVITPRAETHNGYGVLSEQYFKVVLSPDKQTSENIVFLHPDSLAALYAIEGDPISLSCGEEELHSQVAPSRLVNPGQAAINQRMRRQINIEPGQVVRLARLVKLTTRQVTPDLNAAPVPSLVVHQFRSERQVQLWLATSELERLALQPGAPAWVRGRAGMPATLTRVLTADQILPLRAAVLSLGLAKQLGITLGETLQVSES